MTLLVVCSTTEAPSSTAARAGTPPAVPSTIRIAAARTARLLGAFDAIEIIEIVGRRVAALLLLILHQRLPALVVRIAREDVIVERRFLGVPDLVEVLRARIDDVD